MEYRCDVTYNSRIAPIMVFRDGFGRRTPQTDITVQGQTITYSLSVDFTKNDQDAVYTCNVTFDDISTRNELRATNHPGYTFTHSFDQIDLMRKYRTHTAFIRIELQKYLSDVCKLYTTHSLTDAPTDVIFEPLMESYSVGDVITCSATAFPAPTSYVWTSVDGVVTSIFAETADIAVSAEWAGTTQTVRCTVTNDLGDSSAQHMIKVKGWCKHLWRGKD